MATKAVTQTVGSTPRWTLERKIDQKGFFADRVNAVRFSPDGKTLATGGGELSRSGDVILFDVATGKAMQTWKEKHTDTVLCLDFSPDGKRLATGNREVHAIHSLHRLSLLNQRDGAADREVLLEAAEFQQVCRSSSCDALLAHFAPPAISSARKQRTDRSLPCAVSAGTEAAHAFTAKRQRGWKRQPLGKLAGEGTAP